MRYSAIVAKPVPLNRTDGRDEVAELVQVGRVFADRAELAHGLVELFRPLEGVL